MNTNLGADHPERIARTVRAASDLTYVRSQFRIIESADDMLPAPSYYDAAGAAYVPHNYEDQEADQAQFYRRAREEMVRLAAQYSDEWLAATWLSYWEGTYGMCLKDASPENIVRKNWLIDRIKDMLDTPSDEPTVIGELERAVNELDALERPFCNFDRTFFQRPVSRDTYIDDVRRLLHRASA